MPIWSFGRSAIQLNRFALVLPALLLHYFRQGALVLLTQRHRKVRSSIYSGTRCLSDDFASDCRDRTRIQRCYARSPSRNRPCNLAYFRGWTCGKPQKKKSDSLRTK